MNVNVLKRTKIVVTLGPATNDIETIKQLLRSGMDAARINFSHGTYESHEVTIKLLIQAREALKMPIPLILDTKGPEIRIRKFKEEPVYLEQGKTFILTTDDIEGDVTRVSVTYKDLPNDLKKGARVLIDDGLIELVVTNIANKEIECRIINSGFLSSSKGVNIPDVYVNLPSLTQKDIEDIKFGIKMGVDYIAASFVRSASDVVKIRQVLEENDGMHINIISKIENREGVNNIDEILEVSDGIMVARGDLGVEIPPEEVPLVQKFLIKKANLKGKPVITATQMLESMVNNPRPTRAEANDVANAIFDGSDAIMLSGETAKGKYPVESVTMMARMARETEKAIDYDKKLMGKASQRVSNITNAISHATCATAADLNAACIVAVSNSGFTVSKISKYRPSCPIIALTPHARVCRQLNMLWGCYPVLFSEKSKGATDLFELAVSKAQSEGFVKNGDVVVIVGGTPVGITGTTNTIKVQIAGDVIVKGKGVGDKVITGRSNVIKVKQEAEKFFKKGDILVVKDTDNDLLPYIKKASAMIVGSGKQDDYSHAETVARALDIPIVICDTMVIDIIPNNVLVTVDSIKGLVYNGHKSS